MDRVLITTGKAECMRDTAELLAGRIVGAHAGATFWAQEGGVHTDPYFDFLTEEARVGKMTPRIVEWFASGISTIISLL